MAVNYLSCQIYVHHQLSGHIWPNAWLHRTVCGNKLSSLERKAYEQFWKDFLVFFTLNVYFHSKRAGSSFELNLFCSKFSCWKHSQGHLHWSFQSWLGSSVGLLEVRTLMSWKWAFGNHQGSSLPLGDLEPRFQGQKGQSVSHWSCSKLLFH